MDYLNRQGKYRCLYVNMEIGQSAREQVDRAMRAIFSELASRARIFLEDEFVESIWSGVLDRHGAECTLNGVLTRWTAHDSRPLVLLIGEIDSLIGDTLIAVLWQLRVGYDKL